MINDSLTYVPTTYSETHQSMTYCNDGTTYHLHVAAYAEVENNVYYWNIAYAVNGAWCTVQIPSVRRNISTYNEALMLGFIYAESKVKRLRVSDMMRFPQCAEDRKYIICELLRTDPRLKDKVYEVRPGYVNPYILIVADKQELGDIARIIRPYSDGLQIDYLPKGK